MSPNGQLLESTRSLGLLKLKLSQAMDIISQQLEIAELLDGTLGNKGKGAISGFKSSVKKNSENVDMANVESLFAEVKALNDQERILCDDYTEELEKLSSRF
jgi:hypothetical protein